MNMDKTLRKFIYLKLIIHLKNDLLNIINSQKRIFYSLEIDTTVLLNQSNKQSIKQWQIW